MRVDAIASDTSRAAAAYAARDAMPVGSQRPAPGPRPAAPTKDADGDTGTWGGLIDIDA